MQNLSTSRTLRLMPSTKDNESGGNPYCVGLPDWSANFILLYECHNLHFVPYLRMAILQWGGFPGLDTRFLQSARTSTGSFATFNHNELSRVWAGRQGNNRILLTPEQRP